jgi:hypothetical protein
MTFNNKKIVTQLASINISFVNKLLKLLNNLVNYSLNIKPSVIFYGKKTH